MTVILLALANSVFAAEECVFDPETQKETLLELQKQYPGSKVTLEHNMIEMQWNYGTVKYQRGGCVDFGEKITFSTSDGASFSTNTALFEQAVNMATEFFRDFVSGADIKAAIENKQYKYEKLSHGDYYAIQHVNESVISLGILYSKQGQQHVIVVGYYVN